MIAALKRDVSCSQSSLLIRRQRFTSFNIRGIKNLSLPLRNQNSLSATVSSNAGKVKQMCES